MGWMYSEFDSRRPDLGDGRRCENFSAIFRLKGFPPKADQPWADNLPAGRQVPRSPTEKNKKGFELIFKPF